MPGTRASIDMANGGSIVFAPPDQPLHAQGSDAREPVVVMPDRSASIETATNGAPAQALNRYPIQSSKVQPPPLRDDTLARTRLLDWLTARIHDRVVLVLADAGYGKTTLLADFSGRTRLRTIWYRLDKEDGDWIAFLNHLVAAGREHDPGFAATTAAMLADMSVRGPSRDAAIDVFLRELPSIAEHGAVLILDDFHLVDESPDVRLIVRELVARAPERMSIVFASRRSPNIPLARLRASGEVAELGTDDLRFDVDETRRLFADAYGRSLDPDVLADVTTRTEGWAASLQLVHAAIRDRAPAEIRQFIREMSGADRELYDYLAEEVVGDLPDDLQQFLMRTAILQTVTPELASVVSGSDTAEVTRLTADAERLTLLTRPSRTSRGPQRYHPLVREFLEARLRLTDGDAALAALHSKAAEAAAHADWRTAAYHHREAGDLNRVAVVVAAAIPEIMGSGQYAQAIGYVDQIPIEFRSAGLKLVKSRIEMQKGAYESAIALSSAVLDELVPGSPETDHAFLNLATMFMNTGQAAEALLYANRLRATSASEDLRLIADAMSMMIGTPGGGNVDVYAKRLLAIAERQRGSHPHYFGVSMLNLALTATLQDDPGLAVEYASEAIAALQMTSSRIELSSAFMAKATALMMLGRRDEAILEIRLAPNVGQAEAMLERADIADSFDDPPTTLALLDNVEANPHLNLRLQLMLATQWALFLVRRGRHDEALARIREVEIPRNVTPSGEVTAVKVVAAYVAVAARSTDSIALVAEASQLAKQQGIDRWRRVAQLVGACLSPGDELSLLVGSIGPSRPWNITYVADLIARRLCDLDDKALAIIQDTAQMHPGRWRFVLREQLAFAGHGEGLNAARLLESIGDRSDIQRLRTYARLHRRLPGASMLGRGLSRRLADKVLIDDQTRVMIRVADRVISGSAVRRKVLALICFLLTKPDFAATRDQVLDALWPDLDPLDAVNSLNQTVYFLRRILEPDYVDDLSPGYLHHDSDLIWFDRDLVTSRSNECRRLIKELPPVPNPDQVFTLTEQYAGRFALDFEYEEWATPYRDWLHASFLEVVERAVTRDIESGHFERGIRLARRVLDIDPSAEQVEVSLLRLYRASGAHAAAEEQYGHYAAAVREQLGVEPPALESM